MTQRSPVTQQHPSKKKPKVRTYSANSMVYRMVAGVFLIAFGVLLLLASVVRMNGGVFASLQRLAAGLGGGFAICLPILLVWAGVLVVISTQRSPHSRSWGIAALICWLLLTFLELISYTADANRMAISLMDSFGRELADPSWPNFLARAYERGVGGGMIGMVLAWPLWMLMGIVPSAVLCVLLMIVCAFWMFRWNPFTHLGQIREQLMIRRQKEDDSQIDAEVAWQMAHRKQTEPVTPQKPMVRPQQGADRKSDARRPQVQTVPMNYGSGQVQRPDGSLEDPPASWPQQTRQAVNNYGSEQVNRPGQFGFQPVPEESAYRRPETDESKKGILNRILRRDDTDTDPADIPPRPVRQTERRPASSTEDAAPVQRHTESVRTADKPVDADSRPAETSVPAENPPAAGRRRRTRSVPSSAGIQIPMDSYLEDNPPWDPDEAPAETIVPAASGKSVSGLKIKPPAPGSTTFGGRTQSGNQPLEQERPYIYPSLDLLNLPSHERNTSAEEDEMRAQLLEETLASFKVTASVRQVTHGPAVSRFELELAPGINVNRVTNLGSNIAMNMEAPSVRIEAPIPGTSRIGIEIPNRAVSTVTLREVLDTPEMRAETKPLVVALGRDIAGKPIFCNLAKMPHLLIAGATGSGKSVCINAIINSLIYRCSPKDVRMILVDPKVVELQCYNVVPHLLLPVVSDPHKASAALSWAVDEMMDRYQKFRTRGVRNMEGFNSHLEPGEEKMPYIVIIIDELADLMMVCKRDVEERICRIAQLARAAGIHLIVATQRPSVDVITGLIKANIPSRIAFKVTSNTDSRVILDSIGAENLLGWGDMLYKPTGQFTPTRVQGCFLSDEEVNGICEFIGSTCPAKYDPDIIEKLEKLTSSDENASGSMPSTDDFAGTPSSGQGSDLSLLAQCIEIAVQDGQVSTSMLQRRLRVGYSRAGRLVDEMEKRGIVSAQDGSKPRLCLISKEEFEQMKENGELNA